jgi:response regulator RpfG family c-di-GMP phosphodiesterase
LSFDLQTVFSHLDYLVLEKVDDSQFLVIATPPNWHSHLPKNLKLGDTILITDYFYVIETFLPDAHEHWNANNKKSIQSDSWIQVDSEGIEWAFIAKALKIDQRPLLLIKSLGDEYRAQQVILQQARENLLSQEQLEAEVSKRTHLIRLREEELAIRLLDASDFRDEETGAHIRRIGLYSEIMAKGLNWEVDRVDLIRLAASMHDIGKLGIPDSILLKPGRLTDDERKVMQTHTTIGAAMLENSEIELIEMGREIALTHHEKWNGKGYPNQLAANDIPITGRIVAIVDVYDALLSERVYKPAWPVDKVLKLFKEECGKHFDPKLIELFFDLHHEIHHVRENLPD